MTSRERVLESLNHRQPDRVAVDFGGTVVSGLHVSCIEALREHFGLRKEPVKLHEPYQCLGYIEEDLAQALGADVAAVESEQTIFGTKKCGWKEWRTPWGQTVLVGEDFVVDVDRSGDTLVYPQGDRSVAPSGRMPASGYFFDAIIRQDPLPADDADLSLQDNLEEFAPLTDTTLAYLKAGAERARAAKRASILNCGGTGLGDVALVPAMGLRHPKGIRDVAEWYISTIARRDLLHAIFEKQVEIALANLARVNATCGDKVDAVFICGTDFGTQDRTFCGPDTYLELYKPYYLRINDWIHTNTAWKTFKHCCGSIPSFLPLFIDSGFDIINPVQCSAKGMDPAWLKKEFGQDIVFWGGGVNTQATFPFGTPREVRDEVLERLRIFTPGGGFVFGAIHNIQAKTPTANIVAMLEAIGEFNGVG